MIARPLIMMSTIRAILCLLALCPFLAASAAPAADARITIGQAVVALNGPWKFHTGDDPKWAEPAFDDSAWETVDLTPPAGARDNDVGAAEICCRLAGARPCGLLRLRLVPLGHLGDRARG
jgi:hypothetical protein